ncbi:MAG: TonB-dependent receptor [Sporocytophaga sp.]|uniref:TonB-dependent receptor family protein n=1 Tax=Sporocytophaga sp. TaxID=2231183 RepID=UPI001B044BD9|nr:TonB-dependent receptor [Sporocytophaga sp.]MBO9700622.1 TonB-dependent receptor [Sporocytophaga sp.]
MKIFFRNIIIVILAHSAFSLNAQMTTDSLAAIEIKASRNNSDLKSIPSATTLVGKEQFQTNRTGIFIEDALKNVPGIFVQNRNNFAQGERIIIRGQGSRSAFGLRNIKVFLDGIPLTSADGTTQLTGADLYSLSSIEVLRGPSSQIYGNSSGGVIYLKSDLPSQRGYSFENFLISGSYGLFKAGAKFSKSNNKASLLISGNVTDIKGYREFSNARFYTLNMAFKKKLKKNYTLSFVQNFYFAPFLYNPSGLTYAETSDPQKTRMAIKKNASGKTLLQGISGINLIKKISGNQELDLSIFYLGRKLNNPIIGRYIDLTRHSGGARLAYIKKIDLDKTFVNIRTGIDYEFQFDKRSEYENKGVTDKDLAELPIQDLISAVAKGKLLLKQNEHIHNGGFYILSDIERQRFKLTMALRYDLINFSVADKLPDSINQSGSNTFYKLNPGAGLTYKLSDYSNIYSNFSTSFQTPTANEFSNNINGSGFNKQLQPERTRSGEAGIRIFKTLYYIDIAAFYVRTTNQLIPYQTNSGGDQFFYRNAAATQNKGLEVSGFVTPIRGLKINMNYTLMDYTFIDYQYNSNGQILQLKGNKVPGTANHRIYSNLAFIPVKNFIIEMSGQWNGKVYTNDLNDSEPGLASTGVFVNKSYWTFDTKVGYTFEAGSLAFNIFGGINNLFNRNYSSSVIPNAAGQRYFEPSPARNIYIGLKTTLKKEKS